VSHTKDVELLVERIKSESGITDPEQVAILVRVSVRATELAARAATGQDVQKELDILHATALNLSEKVRNVIGAQVTSFLTTILTNAITRVLTF
jgi:hypothetical protein